MVYRSVRPQPPRGSTAWGAQQFSRVLDDEERIAAERERLRALGWRPPQAAAGAYADEPAFGDERDAYADMFQQQLDARRALEDEARRRARGAWNETSVGSSSADPGWAAGGRFATPVPDQDLLQHVLSNQPWSASGGSRAEFGAGGRLFQDAPQPAPALSSAATLRNITRGYTGQQGEGHLPPGYMPRYFGLNDEMAARQWNRAARFGSTAERQAWKRSQTDAATGLDEEQEANGTESLPGLSGEFGDYASADSPPVAAGPVPSEAAQVRLVVDAFSHANIFLSESPETRQDNLDIIEMIKEEVRACGKEALHIRGAGEKERILRQEHGGLKGSRRPDGTVIIGDPNNPDYIWDFNTVDTRPSQGDRLSGREEIARAAIEALKAEIDKERATRFDTYPKSRGKDRTRWRERMRPRVRDAVRALLDC